MCNGTYFIYIASIIIIIFILPVCMYRFIRPIKKLQLALCVYYYRKFSNISPTPPPPLKIKAPLE